MTQRPIAIGLPFFRVQDAPLGWLVYVQTEDDAESIRSQGLMPFRLRVSAHVDAGKVIAFPPDFFDPPNLTGPWTS